MTKEKTTNIQKDDKEHKVTEEQLIYKEKITDKFIEVLMVYIENVYVTATHMIISNTSY